ncbi:MAG: hypothetical protein COA45_12355 [Zetaproteobacteria bacterium]|nr:MAG: hypothetical protein COA45_12355 [Zetaproteobacteria bacterium]
MKRLALIIIALSLTGCVTTKPPSIQKYSEFNFGDSMGFTKEEFNIDDYGKISDMCYRATRMLNAPPQQERFKYCMQNAGYELKELTEPELSEQEKAYKKHKKATKKPYNRQDYYNGMTFDQENFNDSLFISDAQSCVHSASKIKIPQTLPIYSPNTTAGIFNSFFAGIETAKNRKNARTSVFIDCMHRRDYFLTKLPDEERKRREQLIRDAKNEY